MWVSSSYGGAGTIPEINSRSSQCTYDCLAGSGGTHREELTFSAIAQHGDVGLVNYRHYSLPEEAANPVNTFEGRLKLHITAGSLTEQETDNAFINESADTLPPFRFSFVQHGTHFLPVQRQVVNRKDAAWDWILSPGRVWNENADNGFSRVALPFALQEKNANCTHNGVMTFLFNDHGVVSNVAYQIAQETCTYFKFNLHGKVAAEYTPTTIPSRADIIRRYEREIAHRLQSRPISALSDDYPFAEVRISEIGSDQTKRHLTAFGVLYQGIHYRGDCVTRFGRYPFCDVMALPSYSIAKTVVSGIGMMRIEQLFEGKQADVPVSRFVPECDGEQWQGVTLLNMLDMASGNFNSVNYLVDERAQQTVDAFFNAGTHEEKIRHSCAYPRKKEPGTQFVYHTSDTYIVSRMLQQLYQQQAGVDADYFRDLLVADIYQPLHLSPLSFESKRTHGKVSQVWGGYGLTLIADDFAKLGKFLGPDNGKINGRAVLSETLLAESMQQTSNIGLPAGTASRYQHSVWAYDVSHSEHISCVTPKWIPYLSGYGGIGIVILPNGMIYYYVSDNSEYGFMRSVKELHKISSVCRK